MFRRHYAPRTPLVLRSRSAPALAGSRVGLLAFHAPRGTGHFAAIEVLSKSGDLREAAANLFAAMRRLDSLGLDLIVADPVPEIDLGRAIMDRLRRASREHVPAL